MQALELPTGKIRRLASRTNHDIYYECTGQILQRDRSNAQAHCQADGGATAPGRRATPLARAPGRRRVGGSSSSCQGAVAAAQRQQVANDLQLEVPGTVTVMAHQRLTVHDHDTSAGPAASLTRMSRPLCHWQLRWAARAGPGPGPWQHDPLFKFVALSICSCCSNHDCECKPL